jgi:hypothetical protein
MILVRSSINVLRWSMSAMAGATKVYSTLLEAPAGSSPGDGPFHPDSYTARLAERVRSIYRNERQLQLAALVLMLLVYGPLLWVSSKLRPPDPLDLTFNSMLEHMLRGRFDVDPRIVGLEGFARGGRVYAYWGIWCELLRIPLCLFHRLDFDITTWSCLAAVCLAGMAKVRTLILLRRCSIQSRAADWAVCLMLGFILLGGSQIGYLRISVYQEVIFWAYAFATVFIYFALKGLVNRWFNLGTLSRMALFAGLALLTRVPTGVGLLMAMALLLLVIAVQSVTAEVGASNPIIWRLGRELAKHRLLIPLGIIAALVVVAGVVNYFRFENPITFANYALYIDNQRFPDWQPRMQAYGSFNLSRLPFGLVYYFVPVWVLSTRGGQLFFMQTRMRLFDRVEMPPGSFFLTDLLPICFIVLLAIALWKSRLRLSPVGQWAIALATGLLVPCALMLTYISMTYRYRMDFCPAIDFLSFLGLYATLTNETMLATFAKYRKWLTVGLIVNIASSFTALSFYDLAFTPPGKIHDFYHHAVLLFYRLNARLFGLHTG